MKKIIIVTLAIIMVGAIAVGCSPNELNENLPNNITNDGNANDNNIINDGNDKVDDNTINDDNDKNNGNITNGDNTLQKSDEHEIKILGSEVDKNTLGKDILIVEYEYKNKSEKSTSFTLNLTDRAFQKEAQVAGDIITDKVDVQQQVKEVRAGESSKIKVAYALQDTQSPVDIEVSEMFQDRPFFRQTIEIK